MPSSDEENENQSSDDEGNLSNSSGPDDNDDDSQSSQEDGGRRGASGINLTGFLFGNIDTEGKLEEDLLDDESKRQLSTLARLGLMSMLENVIREDDQGNKDAGDSDDDGVKSPTAEDYSDINELAEDEGGNDVDDSVLMPPPPTPTPRSASALDHKKKLETPLAAMLPSKYANIDVRELFPDFRPDKVLCFSRLFGPGKPSSLPQIWRGVKKKRKKKKPPEFGEPEEEIEHKDIHFNYGPLPSFDMCRLDDEIRFLKPLEKADSSGDAGKNADDNKGPNVADWRFGAAQLWYDILGVPEAGNLHWLYLIKCWYAYQYYFNR